MTMRQAEPPQELIETWKRRALEAGQGAAQRAATWVTDGNESDEGRRYKFNLIRDGDPIMYDVLPTQPSLSGEWGGDLTAEGLIEEVTGEEPSSISYEIREELLNSWEEGVGSEFALACERELRKWL